MPSQQQSRSDRVAFWLLAISAVILVGLSLKREFFSAASPRALHEAAVFRHALADVKDAIEIGELGGAVRVVEFVDLQCPACAMYHRDVVRPLLDEFAESGSSVSFRVVPFSLPMHPLAEVAARAAVCALEQGRFSEYLSIALSQQRDFGTGPWLRFAAEAGVENLSVYGACLADPTGPELVSAGARLAESENILQSPTVAINGWLLPRLLPKAELREMIIALLDGRDPFK